MQHTQIHVCSVIEDQVKQSNYAYIHVDMSKHTCMCIYLCITIHHYCGKEIFGQVQVLSEVDAVKEWNGTLCNSLILFPESTTQKLPHTDIGMEEFCIGK